MRVLTIEKPGLQSVLQGAPRTGFRHRGVPRSGAADAYSLALANRAVGNAPLATGIEIPGGQFSCTFRTETMICILGATANLALSSRPVRPGTTVPVKPGDRLLISGLADGMRVYVAVRGGLKARSIMGSPSTYLPARLGGIGRALQVGDDLALADDAIDEPQALPADLLIPPSTRHVLRCCDGAEFESLSPTSQHDLFERDFIVSSRLDRMGVGLEGPPLEIDSQGTMKSAPVFPGTIQCPEGGAPFILLADAQTTGGYPRVAQIIAADRFQLGQLRPGDQVRLMRVTPAAALRVLEAKAAALKSIGIPISAL
ncbi:biotin-dependent carboxyltransferase family protein [Parvularcula sp. LCG005]|uniref:5-oxoprolinase subunit C family protein n=1 Tax=Parvularcula sp. LCG005 TaxID=3078805 RepID=UPI0029428CBE|nr:biotin-dependent carboxyltransferase family protein [Parvularcula sp. LCG005]WOI53372.1 biotin-dependent carboxyltransferase family protein [Parvularcula sp. LCG005]